MSATFQKFPRTPHFPGSAGESCKEERLAGAEDAERLLVEPVRVEEKMDGANLGISFDQEQIRFQSRGAFIGSGRTAPQFQLLWGWFGDRRESLRTALGDRYLLFGEWLYARHTIAYDELPDYFLAFDVWDRETEEFLSAARRGEICEQTGIYEVPLLFEGVLGSAEALKRLLGPSRYGHEPAEGLYLRLEQEGKLALRAKFVRSGWVPADDDHWSQGPLETNQLAGGIC